MINSIVTVAICKACGVGVYMRCQGDVRSCDCGSVTIDDSGIRSVEQGFLAIEPAVVLKKSPIALQEDFDSMADKFGRFANATAMVAHLRKDRADTYQQPKRNRATDDTAV